MSEYIPQINAYLDHVFSYGSLWVYAIIFVACFIENIFAPFPGDSFVVAAGGLVAAGRLDVFGASAVVICGGMGSVMLIYIIGRRFGRDFFIRKNYRYFSAADIMEVEEKFQKRGSLLLLVSRFVVGGRVVLALAAGIGRYPAGKMLVFSSISYVMFAGLLMYLGYKLVENLDAIGRFFRTYNYIVWPIVIAIILLLIFRQVRKNRRERVL